jgi:MarR family transcriptional regulator, organic hydroperoxide resistance regulator
MSSPARRDRPSHPSAVDDERGLLRVEQDIKERLRDEPLDFASLLAVSNIYRAAAGVRRRAEREVLLDSGLSWGGFTILWVLWIWGEMETSRLAAECDLAKGTLTGMVTTLERQELVVRRRLPSDRRRVRVGLTPTGRAMILDLFPRFNSFEGLMTAGLTDEQKADLARLLRVVITNATATEAPAR